MSLSAVPFPDHLPKGYKLVNHLEFNSDRNAVAAALEAVVKDVAQAVEDMRDDGGHHMHHYETRQL